MLSRIDLTEILSYSAPIITDLSRDLIDCNLIKEGEEGASSGGRKPRLLKMNDRLGFLGIIILNDYIRFIVVDLDQNILYEEDIKRYENESIDNKFKNNIIEKCQKIINKVDIEITTGVILIQGIIKYNSSLLSSNLDQIWDWNPELMANTLKEKTSIDKYVVEGMTTSLALVELIFGQYAERSINDALFVYLDEIITLDLIINKKIHIGENSISGRIGHIPIKTNGKKCSCNNYGCLESIVSISKIINEVKHRIKNGIKSNLNKYEDFDKDISFKEIIKAANEGDRTVLSIFRQSAEYVGVALSTVLTVFSPEIIIVGGRLASQNAVFIQTLRETLQVRNLQILNPLPDLKTNSYNLDIEKKSIYTIGLFNGLLGMEEEYIC
jgi:predicted NBD/HSP70 family sugar kinase